MAATQSDMEIGTGLDPDELGYFPDQDLINDLGTGLPEALAGTTQDVTLDDIHHDMVLCNQLLGLIIALLILSYAMAVMQFFIRLVTKNITNLM